MADIIVANDMLIARHSRFVWEYCKDFDATKSYIRAGYSDKGAGQSAHELLKNPEIQKAIEERKEDIAAVAELDAAWVLKRWMAIASADPNEIVTVRRGCCRYCWGINHLSQWTPDEYRRALNAALDAEEPRPAPDLAGGVGFDSTREPHADCPECHGEGYGHVHIADTRRLKGAARHLYAGAQKTKDGIKVIMRDQDAALTNLSRYLGMVVDKKELSGPGGGPIPIAAMVASDYTDDQLAAIASAGSSQLTSETDNLGVHMGVSSGATLPTIIDAVL